MEGIRSDIHKYRSLNKELDSNIDRLESLMRDMTQDIENQKYAYITRKDILNIPALNEEIVLAIKAPTRTTLEVPDPDEEVESGKRRYQMLLKSDMGPIEVFSVSIPEHMASASPKASPPQSLQSPIYMGLGSIGAFGSPHSLDFDIGFPDFEAFPDAGMLRLSPSHNQSGEFLVNATAKDVVDYYDDPSDGKLTFCWV